MCWVKIFIWGSLSRWNSDNRKNFPDRNQFFAKLLPKSMWIRWNISSSWALLEPITTYGPSYDSYPLVQKVWRFNSKNCRTYAIMSILVSDFATFDQVVDFAMDLDNHDSNCFQTLIGIEEHIKCYKSAIKWSS